MTRVLLIEDNPADVYLMREALTPPGSDPEWVVEAAEDGDAALQLLESSTPDLIILDLNLPKTDSAALARAIRARPELARSIVVTWTSSLGPPEPPAAAEIGADRHIVKPLEWQDYEELARVLRRLVSDRKDFGDGAAH